MRNIPGTDFREIYQFGIDVNRAGNSEEQIKSIESFLSDRYKSSATVYLAEPSYPLPAESNIRLASQFRQNNIVQNVLARKKPVGNGSSNDGIPIFNQDHILGAVELSNSRQEAFSQKIVDEISRFCDIAGLNMEIYRQQKLRDWRSLQMDLVETVSAHIVTTSDLETLTAQIVESIQETFGFYYVSIFVMAGAKELKFQAGYGAMMPHNVPIQVEYGKGIIGTVAKTGVAIITPNVSQEPLFLYVDELPDTQAEITLPLRVEGMTLGVMDIQLDTPQAIHEFDLGVLQSLADHIAVAIDSTQTFQSLNRRTEQLSAVLEISQAVGSNLDLEKLLDEVSRLIKLHFDYDFIHIYTLHRGRRKLQFEGGSSSKTSILRDKSFELDLENPRGIIPWVARNNQLYMACDVKNDSLYEKPSIYPIDIGSELAIPLEASGEVLGVLDLQTKRKDGFSDADLPILQAMASSIAIAIRNASLYQSELWRRKVADSFREIAGLISSNTALTTLMGKILRLLDQILPCQAAAIVIKNPNPDADGTDRFEVAKSFGVSKRKLNALINNRPDLQKTLDYVLQSEKQLIRRKTTPRGPMGEALDYSADYSSIAAPMKAGDESLGVLLLAHPEPNRYGTEAGLIASTYANNAAVAIQNISLYRSAQEQAWISNVLFKITELAEVSASESEFQVQLARLMPLLVGFHACYIYDYDAESEEYLYRAGYNRRFPIMERPGNIRLDRSTLAQSPLKLTQNLAQKLGLSKIIRRRNREFYLFPLRSTSREIGFLIFGIQRSRFPSTYDLEQAMDTIQRWVTQIAVSTENLHLRDAEEDQAYISHALLLFAGLAFRQDSVDSILKRISDSLRILMGFENTYIAQNPNSNLNPDLALTLAEKLFMTPESVYQFVRLGKEQNRLIMLQAPQSEKCLLFQPLNSGKENYGYLLALGDKFQSEMQEKRSELISGISQQIASILQNQALLQETEALNRLDQEMQLARTIQKSYLPDTIPEIDGWDVQASWQPARQVGGDFYDVFLLDENKLALAIADVSGKGMPAALNMTVTRTLIRSFATVQRSPAEVMSMVNKALIRDDDSGMFTTAIYAILDTKSGKFTYSNAGHCYPKFITKTDRLLTTEEKNEMALGVLPEIGYQNYELTLAPGDSLLMFTDGVFDTQNITGRTFGEKALDRYLQKANGARKGLITGLLERLSAFRRDAALFDDVTAVSIQRL